MKIIYRQTLKDFIGPFFLALSILSGILLLDKLFLLVDLLVRKGISIIPVAELMIYSLPFVISFCVPIAILIASVMVFGRMAQDNELIALRSAGINPLRLFSPITIFTICLTILMIFFNGYILPEANHRVRNLISDIAQKKPSVRIYEGIFLDDFPGYIIYIGSIQERTGKVTDVTIWEKRQDNLPPALIKAKTGRIVTSPDEKYFIIQLDAGEISELINLDSYRHLSFTEHQINLPIDIEFRRRERKYRSNREMIISDLYKRTKQIRQEITTIKTEFKSFEKNLANEVNQFRVKDNITKLQYKQKEFNQYAVQIHEKYVLACSCFIFLFFGAGLGILIKRSGLGFGFIIGLLFFAVYYILLIGGENLSGAGRVSAFLGVWFGNLLLIPITLELLYMVGFEYSFIKKLLARLKQEKR